MKILVTGCLGYIGSHTVVELLDANYEVIGIDNYSNCQRDVLDRIEKITHKKIKFYEGDMKDKRLLDRIFAENNIDAVIDFAAYKAVGDSVLKPIEYYQNNIGSVLTLLEVMQKYAVKRLIFSSSATVYGSNKDLPLKESSEVGNTTNPYGTSKLMAEKILTDLYRADQDFKIIIFRYFNPVGAHQSGIIGENPLGIPANIMPYLTKVATNKLPCLNIYGDDFATKDGTGVRDYIHVIDLAKAHLNGLTKLFKEESGLFIYNLGMGKGLSVMDLKNTYEKVNNVKINFKIVGRREGDVAECFADVSKAKKELNWEASLTVEDMCRDAHRFAIKNL